LKSLKRRDSLGGLGVGGVGTRVNAVKWMMMMMIIIIIMNFVWRRAMD
jgi:hypothetical protein